MIIDFWGVGETFEINYSNTPIFQMKTKMVPRRINSLTKLCTESRSNLRLRFFSTPFYFSIYLISIWKAKINANYLIYYHQ